MDLFKHVTKCHECYLSALISGSNHTNEQCIIVILVSVLLKVHTSTLDEMPLLKVCTYSKSILEL